MWFLLTLVFVGCCGVLGWWWDAARYARQRERIARARGSAVSIKRAQLGAIEERRREREFEAQVEREREMLARRVYAARRGRT